MTSSAVLFSRRLASQFPEYAQKLQSDDPESLRTSLLELDGKLAGLRKNIRTMEAQKSSPAKTVQIAAAGKKLAHLIKIFQIFRDKLEVVTHTPSGPFDGSFSAFDGAPVFYESVADCLRSFVPPGASLEELTGPLLDGPLEDRISGSMGSSLGRADRSENRGDLPHQLPDLQLPDQGIEDGSVLEALSPSSVEFPAFLTTTPIQERTLRAAIPLEVSPASLGSEEMESTRRETEGSLSTLDPGRTDSLVPEGRGRLDTFASSEGLTVSSDPAASASARSDIHGPIPSNVAHDRAILDYSFVPYTDRLSCSEMGFYKEVAARAAAQGVAPGSDLKSHSDPSAPLDGDEGVLVERQDVPPIVQQGFLSRAYSAVSGMFRK